MSFGPSTPIQSWSASACPWSEGRNRTRILLRRAARALPARAAGTEFLPSGRSRQPRAPPATGTVAGGMPQCKSSTRLLQMLNSQGMGIPRVCPVWCVATARWSGRHDEWTPLRRFPRARSDGGLCVRVNGALTAIRIARLDVVGVVTLGMVTALGGGIIRDVFLDSLPPATFRDWRYLTVAAVGSLVAFLRPAVGPVDEPDLPARRCRSEPLCG